MDLEMLLTLYSKCGKLYNCFVEDQRFKVVTIDLKKDEILEALVIETEEAWKQFFKILEDCYDADVSRDLDEYIEGLSNILEAIGNPFEIFYNKETMIDFYNEETIEGAMIVTIYLKAEIPFAIYLREDTSDGWLNHAMWWEIGSDALQEIQEDKQQLQAEISRLESIKANLMRLESIEAILTEK